MLQAMLSAVSQGILWGIMVLVCLSPTRAQSAFAPSATPHDRRCRAKLPVVAAAQRIVSPLHERPAIVRHTQGGLATAEREGLIGNAADLPPPVNGILGRAAETDRMRERRALDTRRLGARDANLVLAAMLLRAPCRRGARISLP